ncbi:hypothetical protein [Streptomyces sp. NRRL S-448]|uniref:hypothetical protein n=1 Tax=Streptomyces sp. NRRL S-448 TaxID=1463907 RepID=UPI0035618F93
MDDLTAESWADGRALYEDRGAFVAVAPRVHAQGWFDVAAIMRGEEVEAFAWIEPPTRPADAERFQRSVRELPRSSTTSLMVLLGIPGMDVTKAPESDRPRPERERRARLIFSPFPDGTRPRPLSVGPSAPGRSRRAVRGPRP